MLPDGEFLVGLALVAIRLHCKGVPLVAREYPFGHLLVDLLGD